MATMNIVVDMPTNPLFNTDIFKHRVQSYATMLVTMMTKESSEKHKKACVTDEQEALSFIQSLAITGGECVPADINPIECLVDTKYER